MLSPAERSFLSNNSIETTLRLPSIYSYLPHLLKDPHSTSPAFMLSKGRSDGKHSHTQRYISNNLTYNNHTIVEYYLFCVIKLDLYIWNTRGQ